MNKKFSIPNSTWQKGQKSYEYPYCEPFLETILQSIEEGILVLDRDFKIQMANRFFLKMLKIEEKEAIGELCYQLIHRREDLCPDCAVAETFETGKPAFACHTGIAKDGSTIYAELTSFPIFDNKGRVIQVIEKVADVSERMRVGASLRHMKRSLEFVDYCIIITDINGTIHYANPAFTKMTGYSIKEAIGNEPLMLKSNLHTKKFYKEMWNTILSGNVWKGEIKNKRKDGTIFDTMLVIAPVVTDEKEIEGFVGIQYDITERKRVEKEIDNKTKLIQLLSEIAIATSEASTLDEAMQICIDKVCLHTGWDIGHVYLPDSKGNLFSTKLWFFSDIDRFKTFRKITDKTMFYPGVGLIGKVSETGKPLWIEDVTRESYFLRTKSAKDINVRFGFAFPVMVDKKIVAVLEFFAEKSIKPDKALLKAITTLSTHLGRIHERKQMWKALQESEEKLRGAFENTATGMALIKINGRFLKVNKALCNMLGYSKKELQNKNFKEITHPDDFEKNLQNISRMVRRETNSFQMEKRYFHKRGHTVWVLLNASLLRDVDSKPLYYIAQTQDITKRKQAEEERERMQVQLLHSEKLKVVGQLAGGIAHEFNNILMALMGYGETIQKEMKKSDPLRIKVDQILSLTNRAAGFTKSLLTFSRKNVINPKIVKLNEVVINIEKLLLNLLGEGIEIIIKLSKKNLLVKVDISQIEQVLMNLATNARDAMPGGGRILIKTRLKEINKNFVKEHGYGKCGRYALLTFTDTGCGINKKTLEKIFEPFFTTKDTGKGTGLGLSIVYGIIKRHRGFIVVQSRLGVGTVFEIYFPLMQPDDIENIKSKVIPIEWGGAETILIAEDNEEVRKMIKDELQKFGYRVIEAVDGEDAVKVFKKKKDKIQLLLFDVIMPKKNGRKAYEEIKKENPWIKHIFMSGYSKDILDSRGIAAEKINYIFKPISIFELLRTVREVLDKKRNR